MSAIRNLAHVGKASQVRARARRVVYGAVLRNALSPRRASVECAADGLRATSPPAADAARRGAALNLRPTEKDTTTLR